MKHELSNYIKSLLSQHGGLITTPAEASIIIRWVESLERYQIKMSANIEKLKSIKAMGKTEELYKGDK